MNNLNNLLTGLMDTVSKAVSNGKNIDDIASELGVDKDWVKMIINNQSDSEQKVLDAIKKDTIEIFNQYVSFVQKQSYVGYFICDHNRDVNLFTRNVIWVYKNQLIPEVITSTLEDSCFNEMERYCTVEYQFFTHDFEKEYSV